MGVEFDYDEDTRFEASLESLDERVARKIFLTLEKIEGFNLSWNEFVMAHGWEPIPLKGEDTYPGAIELHSFWIKIDPLLNTIVEVVGYTYGDQVVICTIARM